MSSLRPPWMRGRVATELLLLSVVAFPTFMDAWWNEEGTREADWITYTLAVVSVGGLLVRRRWPLGVSVTCGAALTAWYLMDHHGELLNLPTMVALYTVAVQGHRNRTLIVGAVASAWSGGVAMVAGSPVGSPVLEMLWPLVPLTLGEAVRLRHELLAEYQARAERAEAAREQEAHHQVEAERLRNAREFHDVVAHTLAAVNVQMGVAVAAFDTHPETARGALVQARASSKEAMQELRATIALLRDNAPGDTPAPAPRIAQIDDLADTTSAAGVSVTVHNDIEDLDLPAAVELAAHRIVQEALTNVVRHADARNATVRLTLDGSQLVVEVTDDGTVMPQADSANSTDGDGYEATPSPTTGYGLVGMAERAAALGGELDHGPTTAGGFRVRAVLPIERVDL